MPIAAVTESILGIAAERRLLEEVALPLSAVTRAGIQSAGTLAHYRADAIRDILRKAGRNWRRHRGSDPSIAARSSQQAITENAESHWLGTLAAGATYFCVGIRQPGWSMTSPPNQRWRQCWSLLGSPMQWHQACRDIWPVRDDRTADRVCAVRPQSHHGHGSGLIAGRCHTRRRPSTVWRGSASRCGPGRHDGGRFGDQLHSGRHRAAGLCH